MAKLDYAPNNFRGLSPIDAESHAICKVWLTPSLTPIKATNAPYKPSKGLLQGKPYTPASRTDVTETWKRFGWVPNDKRTRPQNT